MLTEIRAAIFALAAIMWPVHLIAQVDTDLTIYVSGDLWEHGGVVLIHPIPTAHEIADPQHDLTLTQRYAEVQFLYPQTLSYRFRFRPGPDQARDSAASKFATQRTSIGGVGGDGLGPEMQHGFVGQKTSGSQTIRILPYQEYADAPTPYWGETQGINAVPPADVRSARVLEAIMRFQGNDPIALACNGGPTVQTCVIASVDRAKAELRWWRGIAEQRLERLSYHALRDCYDNRSIFATGNCTGVAGSDEPTFE